MLDFILSYSF